MNNSVFGKTIQNVRKQRGAKLVTTERRRNYLEPKLYHNTTKFFTESLLGIELRKAHALMNQPVYWSLSILHQYLSILYQY